MRQVILFIFKDKLIISDLFSSRDFDHLYDFQKFYLSKSLERLKFCVKFRQEHDWKGFVNAPWKNRSSFLKITTSI